MLLFVYNIVQGEMGLRLTLYWWKRKTEVSERCEGHSGELQHRPDLVKKKVRKVLSKKGIERRKV